MPLITISRGGGWADRFRAYEIVVDERHCGLIRAKRTCAVEVEPGLHRVQLHIGPLLRSTVVTVKVEASDVALVCGTTKRAALAWQAFFTRQNAWVFLRVAGPPPP